MFWLVVMALFLGVAQAQEAPPDGAQVASRPNVILISMDTTRADALSCYGQPPDIQRTLPAVTPNLDRLAERGLRFEHFYAHAPTTLNSHASMLTGLDPHQHGIPRNGFPLPPQVPTLAERLHGAGYQTVGVIGASALEGDMGLSRGFDVWDDTLDQKFAVQFEDRAGGVVDRALGQVARVDRDAPLFLFVHVFDAHAPYSAPPPFRTRFVDPRYQGGALKDGFDRASAMQDLRRGALDPAERDVAASLYLGEVSYVDSELGRLLEKLEQDGFLEHALVVVTADHGEVLGESVRFGWSHGRDVTDGSVHVPLIIVGRGIALAAPGPIQRQAGMASLAPTIERIAGLPRTLGTTPDLWDLIRPGPVWDVDGWPARPTRSVLHEATAPHQGRDDGRWNNLGLEQGGHASGTHVRHTRADRWVVESGSDGLVPVLQDLLRSWDAAAPPFRSETLSSHTRQALEALGYLDPDEPKREGNAAGE